MPTIFEPGNIPVTGQKGTTVSTLANTAMLGTDALQVERILLQPGADSAAYPASQAERFVYVILGDGQANVGDQTFPLEAESVLWLELQDTLLCKAGSGGLEILLCHAPASE